MAPVKSIKLFDDRQSEQRPRTTTHMARNVTRFRFLRELPCLMGLWQLENPIPQLVGNMRPLPCADIML
jgi:hypothetical protein